MANPTNVKAADVKNTAPKFEIPDFSKWEKEQVGFAPYWQPEPGQSIYGAPVQRDERDPDFVRYLVRAYMPIKCCRGPEDAREEVTVQPGELFTVSVYSSLAEPFNFLLENFVAAGKEIPMYLKAEKQVKTKKAGQTCWTWDMRFAPEVKKLVHAKRFELQQVAAAALAERGAMQLEA